LREVFVNLIVNAVDAMPEGGSLSISSLKQGARLCLQFADSGAGMSEDVRQKIFDPFFTTKGAQGTGLGLSVSYGIIEGHEGSISVTSEPGAGTVFTIDLPAAQSDAAQANPQVRSVELPALTILVIDDEQTVRETLADMLETMDHSVVAAAGGIEALQRLDQTKFDLVFTDLAMPEMDGWETARQIRRRHPETKIVMVTGYGPGTNPPPGEEALVDGIIGKPFDFDQVTEILTNVMGTETELESLVV
jgi:two-component system cell cycle sensor histidine kinase/response regulator CckA